MRSSVIFFIVIIVMSQCIHCSETESEDVVSGDGSAIPSGFGDESNDQSFIVVDEDAQKRNDSFDEDEEDDEEEEGEENETILNNDESGDDESQVYNSEDDDGSAALDGVTASTINATTTTSNNTTSDGDGGSEDDVNSHRMLLTPENAHNNNISSGGITFQEKLRKIKKIPASKSTIAVENNEAVGNRRWLNAKKHLLAIKFIIKPKQQHKQTTGKVELEGDQSGSGSGSGRDEEEDSGKASTKKKSVLSNNTISTYIIKDFAGDSSGSGEIDGSGSSGTKRFDMKKSGSGDEQRVLTFTLKAVVHPIKIKNESISVSLEQPRVSTARERRSIRSKKHRKNLKKAFVPPSDMYVPDKEDVEGADQIENLFFTTLHSNYHARPEFGSRSDPWSETDISEMSNLAGNGMNELNEDKPGRQSALLRSRDFREQQQQQPTPMRVIDNMFRGPSHQMMSSNLDDERQIEVGKPRPSREETHFMGVNLQAFSSNKYNDKTQEHSEEMEAAEAKEVASNHFNMEFAKEQQEAQSSGIPAAKVVVAEPQRPGDESVSHLKANAKLKADKENKDEMDSAEAKYQAMESKTMQEELLNRKENYNLSGASQKAALRSLRKTRNMGRNIFLGKPERN